MCSERMSYFGEDSKENSGLSDEKCPYTAFCLTTGRDPSQIGPPTGQDNVKCGKPNCFK